MHIQSAATFHESLHNTSSAEAIGAPRGLAIGLVGALAVSKLLGWVPYAIAV